MGWLAILDLSVEISLGRHGGGGIAVTKSLAVNLVLICSLAACGDGELANSAEAGAQAVADTAQVGAPKAANVDIPDWAIDKDGCEAKGFLVSSGADDLAGISIGMPQEQIRDLLKCFKLKTYYNNASFYFPGDDRQSVGIDTWILDAERDHSGGVEKLEVFLAGAKDNLKAFGVTYSVGYRASADALPKSADRLAAIEKQYGGIHGNETNFASLLGPDGKSLEQNSPLGVKCIIPTYILCGRKITGAFKLTPAGSVKWQTITLANGRLAAPIFDESNRKSN